jgi:hypothetical protein
VADATEDQLAAIVVEEITQELLRKARWPENSSSAISNEMSKYKTAALANIVAQVEWR